MLKRMMSEINDSLGLNYEIPRDSAQLITSFNEILMIASHEIRIILIIDAVNQLENIEGALDLIWLPPVLPLNVKIILSSRPGRTLDSLNKLKSQFIYLKSLEYLEKRNLINSYLRYYGKSLSDENADFIAASEQTSNPLFLRALLEELRVYGDFYAIPKQIKHYLGADSTSELYKMILARYETDYEDKRPNLVRDVMGLIGCSRKGLSEHEIKELLGSGDEPLPHFYWAPLYLAAENTLINKSGLLNFSHEEISKSVYEKYLTEEETRQKFHLQIADYFDAKIQDPLKLAAIALLELAFFGESIQADAGNNKDYYRPLDEIPWQLMKASSWARLYEFLSNKSYFNLLFPRKKYDIRTYWSNLEKNSDHKIVDAYAKVIKNPTDDRNLSLAIANLLDVTGHSKEALEIQMKLLEDPDSSASQALTLNRYAHMLIDMGKLDEAMDTLDKAIKICEKEDQMIELSNSLYEKARIMHKLERFDEGLSILEKQEELLLNAKNEYNGAIVDYNIKNCLHWKAVIFKRIDKLDEALEILKQIEPFFKRLDDTDGLIACLLDQATIFSGRRDHDAAEEIFDNAIEKAKKTGNQNWLAQLYYYEGLNFYIGGKDDEAIVCFNEGEETCLNADRDDLLIQCLNFKIGSLYRLKRWDEALIACREVEDLTGTGSNPILVEVLYKHFQILSDLKAYQLELFDFNEFIEIENKYKQITQKNDLYAQGVMFKIEALYLKKDFNEAIPVCREAEVILRESNEKAHLINCMSFHYNMLIDTWYDKSVTYNEYHKRKEEYHRIKEELGSYGI